MQTNYQARLSERGSAVSFIIIGLVLVGLFIGGISLIKGRANHVANTPPQTTQSATDQSKSTKQSTPVTNGSTPKATEPAVTTPAPTATPSQTSSSTTSTTASSAIASTGPTETITTMLVLGFVAAMVARYLQSRTQIVQQ